MLRAKAEAQLNQDVPGANREMTITHIPGYLLHTSLCGHDLDLTGNNIQTRLMMVVVGKYGEI